MAKEEPKIKVSVRAVPALGFYRLGRKFLREEAQIIEVGALELAILKDEKNLVVEEVKEEAPEKGKK